MSVIMTVSTSAHYMYCTAFTYEWNIIYHVVIYTAATVRFSQDLYEVEEATGSLEVCVQIEVEGNLMRDITLTLQAEDSTAQSTWIT